jgi:GDP-D-mannose dehydratase
MLSAGSGWPARPCACGSPFPAAVGRAFLPGRSPRTANTLWRLRDLGVESRVRLIDSDLTDLSSIVHAIEKAQPEEVYNLAAQSMVATSWKQPLLTGHVTALGPRHV